MDSTPPWMFQLRSKAEGFSSDIDSINSAINEFRKQLAELHSLEITYSKAAEATNSLHPTVQAVLASHGKLSDRMDNLQKDVSELKKEVSALKDLNASHQSTHEEIFKTIFSQRDENSAKHRYLHQFVSDTFEKIRGEIKKTAEAIRAELVIPPSAILENNEAIMKKVEMAVLDGSNAILKLHNTDTTIKIMDRRIEQLAAQIKKLELEKQL